MSEPAPPQVTTAYINENDSTCIRKQTSIEVSCPVCGRTEIFGVTTAEMDQALNAHMKHAECEALSPSYGDILATAFEDALNDPQHEDEGQHFAANAVRHLRQEGWHFQYIPPSHVREDHRGQD